MNDDFEYLFLSAKDLKANDILVDRGNLQVQNAKTSFADNRIIFDDITKIEVHEDFKDIYVDPGTMFRVFRTK